ncbi:MAG: flagellar biosynthesis protein FlhF, partial [Spirochaetaceae bacterium]|nr:flagellar biosynthesis protein FlhF [Spirochaetaceae bacterium]
MEIYTVQAPTLSECKAIMRERYGERAYIFQQKLVRSGGFLGMFPKENVLASVIVPDPLPYAFVKPPPARKPAEAADAMQGREKILSAAAEARGVDPGFQAILTQVKLLGDKIDSKLTAPASTGPAAAPGEHETIVKISEALEQNDFGPAFRREITERLRRELPMEALDDYDEAQQKVLEWIGERVNIYANNGPYKRPRIIVLAGPTGVGKTTTVCKLAASLKYPDDGSEPQSISLITIDLYRIAAAKQLGELASYLKADFLALDDEGDLKKELALRAEAFDAILIDTIGRSPRDSVELAKMKKMLEVCGPDAEVFLTVTAATKTSDIIDTMRQFEPFGYCAVIVTKLDETVRLGNVLSAFV